MPGWDSPWSSPRAAVQHPSGVSAEAVVHREELPDDGSLSDAAVDLDAMAGNRSFSCIGSRSSGSVALLRQYSLGRICGHYSGVRNLGRQLSDSELPENCLDGKFVSNRVVDIVAASGSHAPQHQ